LFSQYKLTVLQLALMIASKYSFDEECKAPVLLVASWSECDNNVDAE